MAQVSTQVGAPSPLREEGWDEGEYLRRTGYPPRPQRLLYPATAQRKKRKERDTYPVPRKVKMRLVIFISYCRPQLKFDVFCDLLPKK
jgi:hypothetical protein